jgi:FG-GAP-like repeat/Secretion system C-terminal sorting domain/IPT/TIG domain
MTPSYTRTCRTINLLFLLFFGARSLAQPVINSFAPLHGVVNSHLTIRGTGLKPSSGSPVVRFGYELATVQSVTDTAVVVLVPGPGIDGPISVAVNGLTATSSQFFTCTFSNGGVAFSSSSFGAHQDMQGGLTSLSVADFYGNGSANTLSLSGWPTQGPQTPTFIVNTNTGSKGSMNYSQSTTIATLSVPENGATADFDGDGKMDILVDDSVSGYSGFSVFRNTTPGSGSALTFASPVNYSVRALGDGGWADGLYIADFDGDGKTDVVYSVIHGQYTSPVQKDSIHYFHNIGSAGTISFQETGGMSGIYLYSGRVADFDGDGKPDIVGFGSNPTTNTEEVYLLRNTSSNGNISFAQPIQINPTSYLDGIDLAVGDLDGDGKIDIAVSTVGGPVLFRNTSTIGSPAFSYADLSGQTIYQTPSIAMGDLDGDGKADIVIGDPVVYQVSVYRNSSSNGTLSLDPRVIYATNSSNSGSSAANTTVIADVNYDGKPDILQLNNFNQYISVLLNELPSAAAPTVTSFSPTTGGAGTQVTITGTNLTGVDSVSFGGIAVKSFTVNSATTITAVTGNGATGSLIIDAPTGRDTTGTFTFIASLAPQINSFRPATAAQGANVYISGKYFTGATSVSFGGTAASSFSLEGDTAIVAVVGSGATGDVIVTTPFGSDTVSGFTWKAQPQIPAIYYFTPISGTTGDTVLITGYNLTTINGVAFGGVPATSYGLKNDSVVWAVVADGATGAVTVTNPDGSASQSTFTFIAGTGPLDLTRFSPDSATAGEAVYIYGQHLDSITSVSFGNVPVRSFTTEGDTLLIAIVDTGASGKILVSGEWGIDSLSGFRYIGSSSQDTTPTTPPPTVDSFQLQQFIGVDSTEGVLLFWNTLYDQKMQYYFVFGSQDSTNLTDLGTVASGKQNSASYSYSVNLNQSGPWYFQLRMEDTTAAFTNSPMISVTHRSNTRVVNSYPNPAAGLLTVAVPSTNSPSWLVMTDATGRMVNTISVAPNTLQVTIDVSGLVNGVYKLGWSDGKHKSVSTILVMK